MMKSKMKLLCLVFTMVLCMSMTSLTAFASSTEETTEEETTTFETYSLTPEGNLTLVDDIETDSTEDKQFITMQSKNGNYFYLVIDRSGDTDNVYFLNLVDEADLLALIEDAPQTESTPEVDTTTPTDTTETQTTTTTTPDEVAETDASSSIMLIALAGILLLIGGCIIYYFKCVKNKKNSVKQTADFDDFEFEDEDDNTDEEEYGFDFEDDTMEEMENEYE